MGTDLRSRVRWTLHDLRVAPRFARIGRSLAQAAKGDIAPRILARHAEHTPDRPFLRFEDRTATFGAFAAEVDRVAHALRGAGVDRGEVVGVMLHNCPELLTVQVAVSKLGSIAALVNTHLRGDPLDHVLQRAGAEHVIGDADTLPALLDLDAGGRTRWGVGPAENVIVGAPDQLSGKHGLCSVLTHAKNS